MSDCATLLKKARGSPGGLRFVEATELAECWGFVHRVPKGQKRSGTSHKIYKRPGYMRMLNFQPQKDGKAKTYQVRQLLVAIDELQELGEKGL
jgi:hypothetical protein